MTEWLTSILDLRPGMRVLDLGCGRAASSIFLHREFDVQVWAADLWFSASENLERIRDAGVEDGVFPIHADALALPFGADFFDAIVSIDSLCYYGTDDLYLNYLAALLSQEVPWASRSFPRAFAPLVDPGSLAPAFGKLVAAPLGTNRYR